MSVLVKAKCPNGHKFQVNLKKHVDRRERLCPKCKQPVTVQSRLPFLPNPLWKQQKEEQAQNRLHNKQMKKRQLLQPSFSPILMQNSLVLDVLALTALHKKKMEQARAKATTQ